MGANVSLEEWTADLLARKDLPRRARIIATKLHEHLEMGVVPPMKWVSDLQKLLQPAPDCARLMLGGVCGWLRRYGAAAGLLTPKVGEPALCPWRTLHQRNECEGYTRR